MEKIKTYDKFVKDLGQYDRHGSYYIEPLSYALDYCHLEALEHNDKEMLRLMLTDDYPHPKARATLERERRGEKLIPDYVWKAMGKWIRFQTDWWLRDAKIFEHPKGITAEEEKELKRVKRRLEKLDQEHASKDEWRELNWRRKELDPEYRELRLGIIDFVSSFFFRHEYFKGHIPSYKAQARALRDLAARFLKFAEMFEE